MKKLLLCFLLVTSATCFAQKEDLVKYLDAYKTAEFDESKAIISAYSFSQTAKYSLSDYSSINGLIFSTDTTGIMGYKAIVTCKIENELHQLIDKRMIVIMYFDKSKSHWSVFSFREVIDPTHEYNAAILAFNNNTYKIGNEYSYRGIAYWCVMAGKLVEAQKYLALALLEAKNKKNIAFDLDSLDYQLNQIL